MQLYTAALETHPDGSGNINTIVNGNWTNIGLAFNPATGMTASQSGTTVTASAAVFGSWDVGSQVRFADGTTRSIATVTDSTHVEVTVSGTVGSQAFELYKTSESQKGGILRAILGVSQIDATTHDGKMLYVDDTTEKLKVISSITYTAGSDITFTEPVVIDDDDGAKSTEAMLTIRRNMVVTSGSSWAFVVAATVENPSASTASPVAAYYTINTTNAAGNITSSGTVGVAALYVNPGHTNTTYTASLMQGIHVLCSHGSGAANLAEMNGIQIYLDCSAASTCDLARALYIPTIQRSGGADEFWAIYTAGTQDNSYMAGKLIVSDDDTSGDESFATDRLACHSQGTFGVTSKACADFDAENTLNSGTGGATTVGIYAKARYTGTSQMTGGTDGDMLVGAYVWCRIQTTAAVAHTAASCGLYARGEMASGATSGSSASSVSAIRCRLENNATGTTIGTGHALYILTSLTTGTITNLWGIYQAGANDTNYFAANIQMGTTAKPSSLAKGFVMGTGTAATGTVSAGDCAFWFDGSNLRMRIGTTDYTVTKT